MNEMASQVIDGAVSQLQVLEIHSFLRGYHAYVHGNIDSCHGRNAGLYGLEVPCVSRLCGPNVYEGVG